jgi:hypothetical protein
MRYLGARTDPGDLARQADFTVLKEYAVLNGWTRSGTAAEFGPVQVHCPPLDAPNRYSTPFLNISSAGDLWFYYYVSAWPGATYTVDYGDGTSDTIVAGASYNGGTQQSHEYATNGTYTVTVTCTTPYNVSSTSFAITV